MCRIKKRWLVPVLALSLSTGTAPAASVYRCVGATGVVAFSDQPCGRQQERITLAPMPLLHSNMALSPARKRQLNLELARRHQQSLLRRADQAISQVQSRLAHLTQTTNAALDDIDSWQRSHSHANQTAARAKRRHIKRHAKQQRRLLRDHLKKLQQQRSALLH